jgi:hypothetical protein
MKVIAFFFLLILTTNSCSQSISNPYLQELNKVYPDFTSKGWIIQSIDQVSGVENAYKLRLKRNIGDTTERVEFDKSVSRVKPHNFVYDLVCIKTYRDRGYTYYSRFTWNNNQFNLQYRYRVKEASVDSRNEFIIGKYYFLYLHDGLTGKQAKYFMEHKDSLKIIRGNDLPPLPDN